jgi:uncharacterized cupredoxin-like copper-binding protein
MTDIGRRATFLLVVALLVPAVACSKAATLTGEAGAGSDVDRIVEIETTNDLRFDPSEIEAEVGETIEFRVTNVASSEHEFVLGPQHEHTADMQHTEASATGALEPGDSASVIWYFTEAGEVEFACYISNHNQSGMTGTISISG